MNRRDLPQDQDRPDAVDDHRRRPGEDEPVLGPEHMPALIVVSVIGMAVLAVLAQLAH